MVTKPLRQTPAIQAALLAGALLLHSGCERPVALEQNPLDPGVEEFLFPPADFSASGSSMGMIRLTWRNQSTAANRFPLDRSVDGMAMVSIGGLIGSPWDDISVSPEHTYTYLLRAQAGSLMSTTVGLMAWWQTEFLFKSHEILLPSPIDVSEMVMGRRSSTVLIHQSDGRLTTIGYNGSSYGVSGQITHPGVVRGVAMNASGSSIAVAADSTLTLYTSGLSIIWSLRISAAAISPSFNPASGRLLVGGGDGLIRTWRTTGPTYVDAIVVGDPLAWCAYSANGAVIAALTTNGSVRSYRTSDNTLLSSVSIADAQRAAVDSSGSFVAVRRSSGNSVRIIRTSDGTTVAEIAGPPALKDLTFSPDGAELIMVGEAPGILRWDVPRAQFAPLPNGMAGAYQSVAGGEYGHRYAIAKPGGAVSLWYAEPGWSSVPLESTSGAKAPDMDQ